MELAIAIVMIVIVASFNKRADDMHKDNAELIHGNGAWSSPVVQAGHAANGCTGVLVWLALGAAALAVIGGIGAGG